MKATHFLYVGNDFLGGENYTSKTRLPISHIERIEDLANFGVNLVAVWRIKPTNVPLQDRLRNRQELTMLKHGYIPERLYMEVMHPHYIKQYSHGR
jgi:hypothetical protein